MDQTAYKSKPYVNLKFAWTKVMVSPDSHFSVKRVEMVQGLDSVDRGQDKVNDFLDRSRCGHKHNFFMFAFSKLELYCIHIFK